jgi:putative endonuclease
MGIYVYMLRCADGSFYVGSATGDDLSKRIDQHNTGAYPGYTFTRRPVVLIWSEHFDRITDGIAPEGQIKGWSRAKKEALMRSDWAAISKLPAPCRLGEAWLNVAILRGSQEFAPPAITAKPLRRDDGTHTAPHRRTASVAPSGVASKTGEASTAWM